MQGEEEYRERAYIGEHHRSEDLVFLRWGKSQASDARCRVEESGAAKRPCPHLSLSLASAVIAELVPALSHKTDGDSLLFLHFWPAVVFTFRLGYI